MAEGNLLIGKRPSITAGLKPSPSVKTLMTIVPFTSQSRHREARYSITIDEKPIVLPADNLSTDVLGDLNSEVLVTVRLQDIPRVSRQRVVWIFENLTEKVSSKRCFVSG